MTVIGNKNISSTFLRKLAAAAGSGCLLSEPSDCWPYGYDNSRLQMQPGAVVFASSHRQVQDVIRVCNQVKTPLVCRGSGTGTTGATVPLQHAVVLSFERMQQIIGIDPVNRTATVQPGVTNTALQQAVAQYGFFWPPDPTSASVCTIGGNLAYNSAGPRAVKYGTPRENTLSLQAISGDAKSFHTGVLTTKGVVGYDLTRLLIGSEGTLAVITEATLKLTPLAESKRTMRASYRNIHAAAHAVSAIMSQPVTPCALEFMDHSALQMVRNFSDLQLDPNVGAMLMIEVDAMEHAIDEAAAQVASAARVDGCTEVRVAGSQQEVDQLWKTRKALSPALRNIAPKKINEDVAVPISQLPRLIDGLEKLSLQHRIQIVNFGHAGNGNIHVNLLTNPDDPEETVRADACLSDVFSLVLELRGTLSGEHGVGLVKRDHIARELDPVALRLMHQIKRQFDPSNILNPGKTLPELAK